MAQNVKILAGEKTYIHGSYSRPTEDSLAEMEELLIIMLHGFPGDKNAQGNLFHDLEFLLRDKGYHTLRFDFRGCGESDGRSEDFNLTSAGEDYANIISWAWEKGYKRFLTIGEGLGAVIPVLYPKEEVFAGVMLWPFLDLPRIAKTTYRPEQIEEQWIKAGYILKDDQRVGISLIKEMQGMNMPVRLRETKVPILVMHGAEDEISPIDQLDLLRAHAASRRVEITSFHDGTHGLPALNHRKTMYYHIQQFIEKYA